MRIKKERGRSDKLGWIDRRKEGKKGKEEEKENKSKGKTVSDCDGENNSERTVEY